MVCDGVWVSCRASYHAAGAKPDVWAAVAAWESMRGKAFTTARETRNRAEPAVLMGGGARWGGCTGL